jgi:hypothetical protein
MKAFLAFLFASSLILNAAPVKVGTFSAEVRHVFTPAQGLPSTSVRCVAIAGATIYLGKDQGLAVSSDGAKWRTAPAL